MPKPLSQREKRARLFERVAIPYAWFFAGQTRSYAGCFEPGRSASPDPAGERALDIGYNAGAYLPASSSMSRWVIASISSAPCRTGYGRYSHRSRSYGRAVRPPGTSATRGEPRSVYPGRGFLDAVARVVGAWFLTFSSFQYPSIPSPTSSPPPSTRLMRAKGGRLPSAECPARICGPAKLHSHCRYSLSRFDSNSNPSFLISSSDRNYIAMRIQRRSHVRTLFRTTWFSSP